MKISTPFRKTKIIATLGPGCEKLETLEKMLREGMNCARFNFSHENHEGHLKRLQLLQKAEASTGIDIVYMLDTKGPEIRTGEVVEEPITLKTGGSIALTGKETVSTPECIALSYSRIHNEVEPGNSIKIADGTIHLEVQKVENDLIIAKIILGGKLGSKKNVNIPEIRLQLPSISSKDIEDIKFAIKHNFDFISASFIRKAEDILLIREILQEHNSDIHIIAKIENQEGLDNLKSILQVSDGIMIARGDLAEQVPAEQVPLIQKSIIQQCNSLRKIVITATQMLQSMETSNTATRAELTDVANAIFDGTDATMLSGETAKGSYPVEAIRVMHNVALAVEESPLFREHIRRNFTKNDIFYSGDSASETIISAAQIVAEKSSASLFACSTLSGSTPKIIACLRPSQPIIATTINRRIYKKLKLLWGVNPLFIESKLKNKSPQDVVDQIREKGLLRKNEKLVIIGGYPMDVPLQLNTVQVHFEGKILLRARLGFGPSVQGKITRVKTYHQLIQHKEEHRNRNEKYIYFINKLSFEMLTLLSDIAGIVVELPVEIPMDILEKQFPNTAILSHTDRLIFSELPDGKEIIISGKEMFAYEP